MDHKKRVTLSYTITTIFWVLLSFGVIAWSSEPKESHTLLFYYALIALTFIFVFLFLRTVRHSLLLPRRRIFLGAQDSPAVNQYFGRERVSRLFSCLYAALGAGLIACYDFSSLVDKNILYLVIIWFIAWYLIQKITKANMQRNFFMYFSAFLFLISLYAFAGSLLTGQPPHRIIHLMTFASISLTSLREYLKESVGFKTPEWKMGH